MNEINSYEDNVYYFTRNAMNHMLVLASEQIDNFTDEFYGEIKKGQTVLFICMAVMFVVYAINSLCNHLYVLNAKIYFAQNV